MRKLPSPFPVPAGTITTANQSRSLVSGARAEQSMQVLLVKIAGHDYGVSIKQLNNIVVFDSVYNIPTAAKEILGVVNLRGRIATVLDVARVIAPDIPDHERPERKQYSAMTVDYNSDMIALLVDEVGDVHDIPLSTICRIPEKSDSLLYLYCMGLAEVNDNLFMLIDVNRIIAQFSSIPGSIPLMNQSDVSIDVNLFDNPL